MKVLGIACSPRKGKTTKAALEACLEGAREEVPGLETEIIELAGRKINGCIACGKCMKKLECSQKDDFNDLIDTLKDPEVCGIIIGTPVYFQAMTSQCKAFLDRCAMFRRNGFIFRDKVGGALAVGNFRNGGQELTLQGIHAAMLCHDMIVVSDGKGTAHLGAELVNEKDSIAGDELGLKTAKGLGARVAQVASMLK